MKGGMKGSQCDFLWSEIAGCRLWSIRYFKIGQGNVMSNIRVHSIMIFVGILMILAACKTTPLVSSVDYGTSGVGVIGASQDRAIMNCYLAGESATKILELRSEGKKDNEIIKYYSERIDSSWLKLIHDLVPIVAEDNPDPSNRIDYGRSVYSRCMGKILDSKSKQVAEYCYHLNQFLAVAFSFRNSGEPLERAYTVIPPGEKAKVITDAFLVRAKGVSRSQESEFRVSEYYGCLGHPDKAPVNRR